MILDAVRTLQLLLAAGFACAGDWPQFRGPDGQGHSAEKDVPLEWSESRNIVWRTAIPGRGWSSPAVQGDLIWITTAAEPGGIPSAEANLLAHGRSLRALALDRATGKIVRDVEVFRLTDAGGMHAKNSHASPTPIVDRDRVYVHFGTLGTAALSSGGAVLWTTRLAYDQAHGTGGSPELAGDLLIINCDGPDVQFVVALDKNSGAIRWKSPRRGAMAYSTPLLIRAGGVEQIVSTGGRRAVAYEPATGKEIWSVRYGDGFSNVPRPVFAHGLVYLCTGFYQPELMAVRPDGKGDVTATHVAWTQRRSVPLTPSPIVVGGEIYMVSDNGIATAMDARTGKVQWQERLGGNYSASPVYAGGRIYFLSEEGVSTVIAPGAEFRKLAVNELEGPSLASMAVSGGSIFLRTGSHLYRIGK